MDLVVAMAPCVDEVTMTKTFELIRPYLEVRALVVSDLNPSNLSSILVNCVSVGAFFFKIDLFLFQTKEPSMQKKAYRVLEEMCGGERDACRLFVMSNLETLKVVLLETLKNASSPAKRVSVLFEREVK